MSNPPPVVPDRDGDTIGPERIAEMRDYCADPDAKHLGYLTRPELAALLDAYEENRKLRGDLRSRSPNPAAPVAPATDGEPINLALQSSIERMELFVRGAPLARGETTLLRPDAKHLLSEIRRLTEAYQKVLAERDALARWKDKATPALMRKALLESEVARLREDALTPEEAEHALFCILKDCEICEVGEAKCRRTAARTAGTGEER